MVCSQSTGVLKSNFQPVSESVSRSASCTGNHLPEVSNSPLWSAASRPVTRRRLEPVGADSCSVNLEMPTVESLTLKTRMAIHSPIPKPTHSWQGRALFTITHSHRSNMATSLCSCTLLLHSVRLYSLYCTALRWGLTRSEQPPRSPPSVRPTTGPTDP